jgi:hypothetical protein
MAIVRKNKAVGNVSSGLSFAGTKKYADYGEFQKTNLSVPNYPVSNAMRSIGIGGAGVLGFLGNALNPVKATEAVWGAIQGTGRFVKNLAEASSQRALTDIQLQDKSRERADMEFNQLRDRYKKGKISQAEFKAGLKSVQAQYAGQSQELQDIETKLPSDKEVMDNALSAMSVASMGLKFGPKNKSALGQQLTRETRMAQKGLSKGLLGVTAKAPAKSFVGKAINALNVLERTNVGRIAGTVGELALRKQIAPKIGAEISKNFLSGDLAKGVNEEQIIKGPARDVLDIVWGTVTNLPMTAKFYNKVGKFVQGAKETVGYKNLSSAVDKVWGNSKLLNRSEKISSALSGLTKDTKITNKELLMRGIVNWADERGIRLQDITEKTVIDFQKHLERSGGWIQLNNNPEAQLQHFIVANRRGTWTNKAPNADEVSKAFNKSESGQDLFGPKPKVSGTMPKTTKYVDDKLGFVGDDLKQLGSPKIAGKTVSPAIKTRKDGTKYISKRTVVQEGSAMPIGKPVKGGVDIPITKQIPITKLKKVEDVSKQLQLEGPSAFKTVSEPEIGNFIKVMAEKGKPTQFANITDMITKVRPKLMPGITGNLQKTLANQIIGPLAKTKLGGKMLTKINTYTLSLEMNDNIKYALEDKYGVSDARKIQAAIDKEMSDMSAFMPAHTAQDVSNKALARIAKDLKIPGLKGPELRSLVASSIYDTLKANNIFSIKQKLYTKIPALTRLEKLYQAGRFTARPSFLLQQTPETFIYGMMDAAGMKGTTRKIGERIAKAPVVGEKASSYIRAAGDAGVMGRTGIDVEKSGFKFELAGRVKSASIHYLDAYKDAVAKTPLGKQAIKQYGNIDKVPHIKEFTKRLNNADDPALEILSFIKENKGLRNEEGRFLFKKAGVTGATDPWKQVDMALANKAWDKARDAGAGIQLYNPYRSAWERQLHNVAFPYSYVKKFTTKVGKYLTTGKAIRPIAAEKVLKTYTATRDEMEKRAVNEPQWRPLLFAMSVFDPFSTEYPITAGGLTPFWRTIERMAFNPDSYNMTTDSGRKLVLNNLVPALKEANRYMGFLENAAGREENYLQKSFYPEYNEVTKKMVEDKKNVKKIKSFSKEDPEVLSRIRKLGPYKPLQSFATGKSKTLSEISAKYAKKKKGKKIFHLGKTL